MQYQENVPKPAVNDIDPEMAYKLARLHWGEAIAVFSWLTISVVTSVIFFVAGDNRTSAIAGILFPIAIVFLIYHCRALAIRKWNAPAIGFLGLLPIIGVVILVALPGKPWQMKRTDYAARRRRKLASWR